MSAIAKASPKTVASTAVAPLLSSPEAIKLQKILDEVWSTIETVEKILPARLLPFSLPEEFSKNFTKFGGRFLKLLKHIEYGDRIRAAVARAGESLGFTKGHMKALATSRFNIGECQEITTLIRFKAHLAGIKTVCMLVPMNPFALNKVNHSFLMVGKEIEEAFEKKPPERGDRIFEILKKSNGLVIDGLLHNKVITAKDVVHCHDIVSYYKAREITQYLDGGKSTSTIEEAAACMEQAERIYLEACKILSQIPPQDQDVHTAILENEPGFCADLLKDKIPDTKWSKNAAQQKVWFEGTEDKAKEIAEYLNAHGIKATVAATARSTHLAMIENPDYNLIEKLPPFEQWQKEKVSQAAPEKDKKVADAPSKKKKKKKGKS
jgi:hypothetical protein